MAKLELKEKTYLLSLKPEDITFDVLLNLFADTVKREGKKVKFIPSRMKTSDEFELAAGEYFNKIKVRTNAGQFIYNKLIIERELQEAVGYVSDPIDKNVLGTIDDKLSKALLNDRITVKDMVTYLDRTQWLSKQFHSVISGSFTPGTLKPHPDVIKLRDKLLKENRSKLDAGDVIAAAGIEKQLLDVAKDKLKGDHGLDLYKSGARGTFGNNFKSISVMKGPIYNPTTGKFDIVESNLMEGIRKEELDVYGNAIITGAYPKAVGTAVSGYFSKQIIAALQAIVLDKKGSDCGSKNYLEIVITPSLKNDMLYRYVIEGNKLVQIDDSNIDKYVNKKVKLRSKMYCIGEKLCNACAGDMYYKLEINNVGMTAARVSSTLLNLSMKKFHDTSSKITKINISDLVL